MLSRSELSLLGRSPTALKVLATIATTRCSPFEALDRVIPQAGYTVERGLPFGAQPRHKLDVYRPDGGTSAPVVVFLYGGAWRQGSREGYRFIGEAFTRRGYVTVVPDYRLFPAVRFPAFVEDAAAAVAWVHRNIAEHGGDPDRIVLVGHSAGAHIASLLAMDRRYLAQAGVPHGTVRALAGIAGPYAFKPLEYGWVRPIFEAAVHPEDARPISFAHPEAPPTLLLHGGLDETVLPQNADELHARLTQLGARSRRVIYPKLGHITVLLALASPFRRLAPAMDDLTAFVDAALSEPRAAAHRASA